MNHVFVRSGSLEEETELAKRTFEETLALCDEDEYPGDFGGEWRPVEMTMIFKNDTEISVDGVKIPAQHFNTVHSDLAVQVALQKEETEKLREELKKVSQKYDEAILVVKSYGDVLDECEMGQCDGCEDWYHMDRLDNGDGDGGGGLWCQWCMPDEEDDM